MRFLWMVLFTFLFFFPSLTEAQSCSTRLPTVPFEGGYAGDSSDLVNGFWIRDPSGSCYFTPGLITYSFWMSTPVRYSTRAIWQADGVIEVNAALKGIDLSDVAGGIAINSCAYDGMRVWIRVPDGNWIPVRVVDCVHREHAYHHSVTVGSGLELSWALAQQLGVLEHINQWGGIGMYGVEVCLQETPCNGSPVDYTEWFLNNLQLVSSRSRNR